jgi:hypothetical protein
VETRRLVRQTLATSVFQFSRNTRTVVHVSPLRNAGEGVPSAAEIAEAVSAHGQCLIEIDPLPTQKLVDLHWAAHQAGSMLGIKVRVIVETRMFGPAPCTRVQIVPRTHERSRRAVR